MRPGFLAAEGPVYGGRVRRGSKLSALHIPNHPTAPLLCPLMQSASLHHHVVAEVTSDVDKLPLMDQALNAHQWLETTCPWPHRAQMASHHCCGGSQALTPVLDCTPASGGKQSTTMAGHN